MTTPELSRQEQIHLPAGLLGFESIKFYLLSSEMEEAPFSWLQASDDVNLAFLVIPPFDFVPEYQPEISDEDVQFLGLTSPLDAWIFNIVTLRTGGATMNLKGPVVINRHTLIGKQVVLVNAADYSLQHPLPVA
ncbi:MAG: flagellar assembly protein FliW [Verrucomicrobiota bacterium]|nr:flagellar assembly protein FliW [Verrucomicrobiota bacterium]